MTRRPAKQKTATAAKPVDTKSENTQRAEDSLQGDQTPEKAEAPHQPPASNGGDQAAVIVPPDATAAISEPDSAVADDAQLPEQDGAAASDQKPRDTPRQEDEGNAEAARLDQVEASRDPSGETGVVVVTGPRKGRRRIGRRFGVEPVEIPLDMLTPGDLTALCLDPLLDVGLTGTGQVGLAAFEMFKAQLTPST